MTTPDIEAIKKRTEAATEGPWKTHLVDDTSIVTEDGTDVCTTCDSTQAEREDGYNVEYERMEADAQFIAHARSDIPALLSYIDTLKAEHEAELLEFSEFARKRVGDDLMSMTPKEALASYRAQKEKK